MNIGLVKVLESASAKQTYTCKFFHSELSKSILYRNTFFFVFFQEWVHGKPFENCCLIPKSDSNRGWTLWQGAGGWWIFLVPDGPPSGLPGDHLLTALQLSLNESSKTVCFFHILYNARKEKTVRVWRKPFWYCHSCTFNLLLDFSPSWLGGKVTVGER